MRTNNLNAQNGFRYPLTTCFSRLSSSHGKFNGYLKSFKFKTDLNHLLTRVVWLLVRRVSSRERRLKAEKLTKEEEEELLAEWKPEPLVPDVDPDDPALHVPIISEKVCTILRSDT